MPDVPANSTQPDSRADWRAWLETHHTRPQGVWLVSFKKATGRQAFDYGASVEEALCSGWVDSKPGEVDDERSMLWFAPRKPRTGWSRPNKERVGRLIAAGLMMPAGLAEIEAAKRDGSWTKLDSVEDLDVPPDLLTALTTLPDALARFTAFPRSVKRGILEWILNAKREETRAKRIAETATLAARNERANQWKPR